MKIKSNRFKCRNLPTGYEVKDTVGTKSTFTLILLAGVSVGMILQKSYFLIGILLLCMSLYILIFSKNKAAIEFCDRFMIYYIDDSHEDCYLIYYDEIDDYEFKRRFFDTDLFLLRLKNQKVIEIKCLDHKKVSKNLSKYVKHQKIEEDDE